ncbi:MAG: B12-binding domain-containing radical SAM protein [Candidatus Hodarchaeota archaeon]
MAEFKLLLAECIKPMGFFNIPYRTPSEYQKYLIGEYANVRKWFRPKTDIKKWAKDDIFNQFEDWPEDVSFVIEKDSTNNALHFLKDNISTYCKILKGIATPERILHELEQDNYTHVGLGVFVAAYTTFKECVKAIRKNYPHITILAGNAGTIFPQTKKYADLVCRGRGVPFLRNLFNEDPFIPYNPGLATGMLEFKYNHISLKRHLVEFVTKMGCPHKCDFCITNKFFDGKFSGILVSPEIARDALVEHRKAIGNQDFTTYFCEPTAITDHKWWYELIELFEDEDGHYPLILPTTAISLKNFDLDKTMSSTLKIDTVGIGIENFDKNYRKNQHVDVIELIKRLTEYGIATYASYIVGFPHQTEEDIWYEINKLLSLNASFYEIHNIKVLPETPLWNELKAQKRLLKLPTEFYYLHGFQSFKHDHFRPGFVDIWPLIFRIRKHIEREMGNVSNSYYELMKNLVDKKAKNWRLFRRNMKMYQKISQAILLGWIRHFNPSDRQIQNYLERIDSLDLYESIGVRKSNPIEV